VLYKVQACGKYTLDIIAKNQFECIGKERINLDVVCLPNTKFDISKDCDNTLVSFINQSDPGMYVWDFGDQQTSTEINPVHNYQNTGRYTVSLKVNAECKNEFTRIIDVGFIMINLNDTVLSCHAQPVFINPNPDLNYTYMWSPAEGLDDPNSANPLATVPATKTFRVRITDPKIADCFIEREVTVLVPPQIDLEVNRDTILCYTDSLLLQAKTIITSNIEWTDEIGLLLGKGYQLHHKFRDSTLVVVYAIDIQYGCTDIDTFKVIPVFTDYDIVGDSSFCPNDNGFVEFKSKVPHRYTLNWSPSRFIVGKTNEPGIIVRPPDTTVFYIDFVDEYGCAFKDSFTINISRFNPPLDAYADRDTIYLGESTYLHVNKGYPKYNWEIPYKLDCTDCTDPLASPEFSTRYTVVATNHDGCTGTAEVSVFVIRPSCDENDIYTPNIFSPNDDGENDQFIVRSNFIDQMDMIIYDRWGEKVFETKDRNKGWDGFYKGEKLPPDVYAYYYKVVCTGDGKKYSKKGNVTLLR
jgi:gliding motility-associated-like protein